MDWSPLWEEFYCDWRELWFNQRVEPPSWVLADEALAAGAKGILFGSRIADRAGRHQPGALQRDAGRPRQADCLRPGGRVAQEPGFLALTPDEGGVEHRIQLEVQDHQHHDKYTYHGADR